MLHIHHAENEAPHPAKAYADAAWAANPAISPAWWRELLGLTVSKIALDARHHLPPAEHLTAGVNLILTSPATHAAVARLITGTGLPPGAVTTVCLTATPILLPQPHPTLLIWQVQGNPPACVLAAHLQTLERHVQNGHILAYGLAEPTLSTPSPRIPLHQWQSHAQAAAAAVYGRRKRPGLRLLLTGLDFLNLNALTLPTAEHTGERVSVMEFAARLGWGILATAPVLAPSQAEPEPDLTPVTELTAVAEQEDALNHALGGWPQVGGQPLFSVLAALAAGQSPWPTPHHAALWSRLLLPTLIRQWRALPHIAAHRRAVAAYCRALAALRRSAAALGRLAATPLNAAVLQGFAPNLPPHFAANPASFTTNVGLLASIPGLSALIVPHLTQPELSTLLTLPDHPDIGHFLAPQISLAKLIPTP